MSQPKPPAVVRLAVAVIFAAAIAGALWWQGRESGGPSDAPASAAAAPGAPASPAVPRGPGAKPEGPGGASGAAGGPATGPGKAVVTVGAWNIEWLGKPEDRSGAGKGVAQSPVDLAEVIAASGADVLAVAEVVTRVRGRPVRSREVEAVLAALNARPGQAWDYVLCPGRAEGDQLTGVLWNARTVTLLSASGKPWSQSSDAPWAVPVDLRQRGPQGSALWNRPPHAFKFSAGEGRTDFVVIPVHMKADFQGDFAEHRRLEAAALVAALPQIRRQFSDQDVIIAGDTNCARHEQPAIGVLEAAGFKDLNAADAATHWRGGAMDRVLVPTGQPEFRSSAFRVAGAEFRRQRSLAEADWKKRYSDHYAVTATVQVGPDDD